jgi:hypothetical protein
MAKKELVSINRDEIGVLGFLRGLKRDFTSEEHGRRPHKLVESAALISGCDVKEAAGLGRQAA